METGRKRFNTRAELLRLLWRGTLLLALMVVTWFIGRAAWDMYGRFEASAAAAAGAEADLARLQGQYAQMEGAVGQFSSPRGREAAVRERYGVARPGEGEIDIIRPAPAGAATGTPESGNIFVRLWNALVAH